MLEGDVKKKAPECRPPCLLLTASSRSYFLCESTFAGIPLLLHVVCDVSAPSFCLLMVVQGREIKCVVQGRKIKNAHCWSCRAEKIKCCYQLRGSKSYQLRGSKKHVHSKERSTGQLYECLCASASV